jgi:hypothetical protein
MIPAQSAKKRGQLSAVGDQLKELEPNSCEHRKFFCDVFPLRRPDTPPASTKGINLNLLPPLEFGHFPHAEGVYGD